MAQLNEEEAIEWVVTSTIYGRWVWGLDLTVEQRAAVPLGSGCRFLDRHGYKKRARAVKKAEKAAREVASYVCAERRRRAHRAGVCRGRVRVDCS